MKVTSLLFILLCCSTLLYSQKSEDFGNITVKELSSEPYAADTASAVVLFDIGELTMDVNSTSGTVYKRHMRVKILKKSGLSWASRNFYISKSGNLKVKGATYNLENGVIRKSELEEIVKDKYDLNTNAVHIAFPNAKEGSIVEFVQVRRYAKLYTPDWEFQHSVPTRKSEYTISIPIKNLLYEENGRMVQMKRLNYFVKGSIKPAEDEEKYEGAYHRWLFKDVPAFNYESNMPDQDAYTSGVVFESRFLDWESVYHSLALDGEFGEIARRKKFLEDDIKDITTGLTDDKQKIKVISDYVKHRVQFNGEDTYSGSNSNGVLDKKTGTSGDINLLFGSLLGGAGFKVNLVLLSTRDNGVIEKNTPGLGQFNYVVCEVTTKDGEILVDATEKLLPFDMLPPRCYNQTGFLVGTGQYGWIPVFPTKRNKVLLDATVTFTESGGLTGKLKSYKEAYAAFEVRKKYTEGGEKDYKIDLGNKLWNIQKHEIQNINSIDKPVEESCEIAIEEYVMQANDKIYFNPHLFLREDANPFSASSRTYPIDFEKLIDNTVVCNLVIPDNYTVEEVPENKVIVLPGNGAKCVFSTSVTGNKIQVMSKLIFNKAFFLPEEYAGLKEFYGKLVAKKSENIVLKKKG